MISFYFRLQCRGACLFLLWFVLITPALAQESVCYGTTSNGRLEGGVSLPKSGPNFRTYSSLGHLLGRTYVHSRVKAVILASFKALERSHPDKVYMYAETGWEEGGRFRPHKTHQNGLSVDFMVPVTKAGTSVYLPISPFNKFGYNIEFDESSTYDGYHIDYEAMGAHLVALHQQAQEQGFEIWRVIFDPKLQTALFNTVHGDYLKQNLIFSKKRSWVRHDEHYHVDFTLPCRQK